MLAKAAQAPANCTHTSAGADGHTCGHGTFGPFDSRVAIPYPDSSALDIPNVDPTHTLYSVLLSGESSTGQWVVSYKPGISGTYAFYLDVPGTEVVREQPFAFELRDAFGELVPVRLEHVVDACPGYFAWVKVYEIDAARYHLILGGDASESVHVAVEHVDVMGAELFTDADGDGYGTGVGLASWCGAAPGYSVLQGDCDDHDALVFPNEDGVCEASSGSDCDENGSGGWPSGSAEAGVNPRTNGGTSDGDNPGETKSERTDAGEASRADAGTTSHTRGDGGRRPLDALTQEASDGSVQDSVSRGDGASGADGGAKVVSVDADVREPVASNGSGLHDEEPGNGCSCRVGTKPRAFDGPWAVALLGYLWLRRRQRCKGERLRAVTVSHSIVRRARNLTTAP